jgi:alpha-glucosidase/alpha-D-xyloside xylohydrolase
MVDFTDPESEAWWRAQAVRTLRMGVEGIKADDGEGYYIDDDPALRRRQRRRAAPRGAMAASIASRCRRALDEAHGPGRGVPFRPQRLDGQQATGMLWAGDQASDFWSLGTLVSATIAAAGSGFSNWSHDVGGYLGHRLVERCPKELLLRWAQLGCFTPLMQAHGRLQQEPWTYDRETLDIYRGYVLLHEMLNPYLRAAAATATRCGMPMVRPASLLDPSGWDVADAFGLGPSLWVAPVIEEGARERDVLAAARRLDRGLVGRARARRARGAGAGAAARDPRVGPRGRDRRHPSRRVGALRSRRGRRAVARDAVGRPRCGRALARLADGTLVRWAHGRWSAHGRADVTFARR